MVAMQDIAMAYVARGWNPVPIPYKTKGPKGKGWHLRKIDAAAVPRFFNGRDQNIGIVLGPLSNNLTDGDLDCEEALKIAPYFMPRTAAMFGRQSKRCSHLLFYTDLAETFEKAAIQFKDPVVEAENNRLGKDAPDLGKAMLLELRFGGGGHAAQTIFPGPCIPPASSSSGNEAMTKSQPGLQLMNC